MRTKKTVFGFIRYSHKLIEATQLLRHYGFLEEHEFPKILSPIILLGRLGGKASPVEKAFGWEVTIRIRESMDPSEVILFYNQLRNELRVETVGEHITIMQLTEKWHRRIFKSRR